MRTKLFLHSCGLLLLLIALPAVGRATDSDKCQARCNPIPHLPAFIDINANTGQILGGTTRFAEGEKVQVLISGKNPFKYAYRTQIVSSPLDPGTAAAFLRLVPGAGALIDSVLGTTQASGVAKTEATGIPECTLVGWSEVKKQRDKLTTDIEALKKDAAEIKSVHEEYAKFVEDTDKDSLGDTMQCAAICVRAGELVQNLDKLIDLKEFKEKVAAVASASKKLQISITALRATDARCKPDLDGAEKIAQDAATVAETLAEVVNKLEGAKASFEALGKIIKAALADEHAFREEHFPYTGDGPTNVRITLFRRNLRVEGSAEKEVTSIDLKVGQGHFSISAGIGFSTLEDKHIIRDGEKFGEENKSSLRPSLTVMLNAQFGHLWSWSTGTPATQNCPACPATPKRALPATWGISTGLVVSNRNDTTQTEFILGPSLGLLDNNLFMTLGLHLAQVEKLGGGHKIGEEIPADLTGELPVKKDWAKGFMLAVTYKMR